jgi:hypothetical protein
MALMLLRCLDADQGAKGVGKGRLKIENWARYLKKIEHGE